MVILVFFEKLYLWNPFYTFYLDYIGNPLQGCRRECESSRDCSAQQECVQFRCLAACREGGKYISFG